MNIEPIAYIKTSFKEKFGIPRQSGLIENIYGEIIFDKSRRREYNDSKALDVYITPKIKCQPQFSRNLRNTP